MAELKYHGQIGLIPTPILEVANRIKHQNYQVNKPNRFHKEVLEQRVVDILLTQLSTVIWPHTVDKLDWVYFSCASGAEEHVDELDPEVFLPTTFVIPVILPSEGNFIKAHGVEMEVRIGGIYEFNHETPHSMKVGDETGAVVIMIGMKK